MNHDLLMGKLAQKIGDVRVLKLIRRYLEAGMMAQGLVSPRTEGTPQGGPVSPLLSNILLDELDRERESRGLAFCRYADDCNIYVGSERAGKNLLAGLAGCGRRSSSKSMRARARWRSRGRGSFWATV